MLACWAEFVLGAVGKTALDPRRVYATSWAMGETAHWVAGKHILAPDDTFATAILIETGLIALMYALSEVYVALTAHKPQVAVVRYERSCLGFDHQEVGAASLRQFRFSEEAAQQAGTHHEPLLTLGMTGKVLRAASAAVAQAGGDFGLGGIQEAVNQQVLEGALLRPEHEPELLAVARSSFDRALEFGYGSGSQVA